MRSRAKILLAAAALLVAALAATVIALKVFFPPERIEAFVVERLGASLGREIRIASSSIGLSGARLEGVEISEIPDFKAGTIVKARRLRVSLRLWALLRRRELRVTELALDGWELKVVRGADGAFNVLAAAPSPGESKETSAAPAGAAPSAEAPENEPAEPGGGGLLGLGISRLRLRDGSVSYEDRRDGTRASLSGIELSADEPSLERSFDLRLDCYYSVSSTTPAWSGRVEAHATIDAADGELDRASVELKSLELRLGGLEARLKGRIRELGAPKADLELSLPELKSEEIGPLAPVPEGFHLPPLKGTVQVHLRKEGISLPAVALSGKGFLLKGGAEQTGDLWRIRSASLGWGPLELRLDGSVRRAPDGREAPLLDLRIRSSRAPLAEAAKLMPGATAYAPSGHSDFDIRVKGPSSSPELSGSIALERAGFTAREQTFAGLGGSIAFSPEAVQGEVRGKWNGAELRMKVDARDYRGPKPRLFLDGDLSVLDLSLLPDAGRSAPERSAGDDGKDAGHESSPGSGRRPPKARSLTTSGRIVIGEIRHPKFQAAASTLAWSLHGVAADLSKLGGEVKFHIGEGRFEDLKTLSASRPLLKTILLPVMALQKAAGLVKIPLFPAFDKVQFKEIVGDYVVEKGVMKIRKSRLDSRAAFAQMTGTADLVADRLDLHVSTKLGAQVGLNISGPIGFNIRGSLSHPVVKLDPASLLKQPGVEKAIKTGQDLLRSIFK
ncbi:MAG: AsmA-like C-terminal region-containing protein [Elusimicrobiota bacterium]